jgi:hypothetical protein
MFEDFKLKVRRHMEREEEKRLYFRVFGNSAKVTILKIKPEMRNSGEENNG